MIDLCDPRNVRDLMATFGLRFRKEFGQNFLCDRDVVETIADEASDDRNEAILEIGPGAGTLTRELAKRYREVLSLEIDPGLLPVLRYTLNDLHNVTVVNEDVMKADLPALLSPYFEKGGVSVCANLPYYITTPILMSLLESRLPFSSITVMVQKEVAERLTARPGDKKCGAITSTVAYFGEAEPVLTVTRDKFMPPPNVDSQVIRIRLHKERPVVPNDEELFFRTVRVAFEQRRKTLPNALAAGFPELPKEVISRAVTEKCGLSADIRGERLSLEEFCRLSDAIGELLP